MSACPVPGCTEKLRSGYLMCKPHWCAVPLQLRRAVHATWRAVRKAPERTARLGAIADYQAARDKAIAAAATKQRSEAPLCD